MEMLSLSAAPELHDSLLLSCSLSHFLTLSLSLTSKGLFCLCSMTEPQSTQPKKRGRPRKYHTDTERQKGVNARQRE